MQRMDRKDPSNHFDICTRLFNIAKTFSARVLKPIGLVWTASSRRVSAYTLNSDSSDNRGVNPLAHGKKDSNADPRGAPLFSFSNDPSRDGEVDLDHGKKIEQVSARLVDPAIERQAKAPKKSVSINENAEEIVYTKRKLKKKKCTTDDLASSDQWQNDDQKPLKSILKVGSDLNRKSDSFGSDLNRRSDSFALRSGSFA